MGSPYSRVNSKKWVSRWIDRIREGLDPIHVIRDPEDDVPIRTTADNFYCTWEEGQAHFTMSVEARLQAIGTEGKREAWRLTSR